MSYTHAKVVYAVISVVQIYHRATDVDTFTLKYSDLPIDVSVRFPIKPGNRATRRKKRKAMMSLDDGGAGQSEHYYPMTPPSIGDLSLAC